MTRLSLGYGRYAGTIEKNYYEKEFLLFNNSARHYRHTSSHQRRRVAFCYTARRYPRAKSGERNGQRNRHTNSDLGWYYR
jgi:hypothetical protein